MTTDELKRLKQKGGYVLAYDYGENDFTIKLADLIDEGFVLFSDTYPLTPALKTEFEKLFIDTYLMREIGFPTVAEFKRQVYLDLNKKSKHYNKLFEVFADALLSDPKINQRITTNTIINALSGVLSVNKFNDTPKGKITAITDGYLSSLGETDTDATSETSSNMIYEGFTDQEINLINNYASKLRDIMSEFVDMFDKNFMQLLTATY